nr:MAG TPA: hypothetical protein [Caudoviricetes sp.]DAL44074.1 MAG TPA_asm: hypothetical protein [Caudoviricetes sp.]
MIPTTYAIIQNHNKQILKRLPFGVGAFLLQKMRTNF